MRESSRSATSLAKASLDAEEAVAAGPLPVMAEAAPAETAAAASGPVAAIATKTPLLRNLIGAEKPQDVNK